MSITSADAVITLTVAGLYDTPVQLQNFMAEDIFKMAMARHAETVMGADGKKTQGYVFTMRSQTFGLLADSPSCDILDTWNNAEEQAIATFRADMQITLPSLRKVWTMTNGTLTEFNQMPDAGKLLGGRHFTIEWERAIGAPL